LRYLYLDGNQLRTLPPSITRLRRLRRLVIGGNPMLNIPPEVVRQGWGKDEWSDGNPLAVLSYLQTRSSSWDTSPVAVGI
jgi:internalin A